MRKAGEPRPARPQVDEKDWPLNLNGVPDHPWKFTTYLRLLDIETGELSTFWTNTVGGNVAIGELSDQIAFMRQMRPNAIPVIALESREVPTQFGTTKPRPHFRILGWRQRGDTGGPALLAGPEQSPAAPQQVEHSAAEKSADTSTKATEPTPSATSKSVAATPKLKTTKRGVTRIESPTLSRSRRQAAKKSSTTRSVSNGVREHARESSQPAILPHSPNFGKEFGAHILHRDFETRSTLDLTEVGAWRYAAEPTTGVWCVAYAVNDAPAQIWIPGQRIPEEFYIAAHDPDWIVVAHNDAFERAIEERILQPQHGWPIVPIERHACTMAMASASALPAKLKTVAEALQLSARKGDQGARLMQQMARPRKPRAGEDPNGVYWHDDPEKLEQLYAYCRQDVEVERELFHRLPPLADSEQTLWQLDAAISGRGFCTDGPLLVAASRIAAAAGQAVQDELIRITAGELTSTDQVAAMLTWLAEHGCQVKDLRKPTLKHALYRKELDPVARRVIELRLGAAHAAAAKIDTLLAWQDTDHRVRGTLRFHGAGTGRWTGHGPQPQNFKRDSEGIEAKRIAIETGDLAHVQKLYPQPLEIVGDSARAMICAAPGHRFLIGDFSGIESRVLAWVSGQQSKWEQWAKFDRTGDPNDEPYYILGRGCGQSEESARSIGKTADLAFGFMGGAGAWDRLAPDDDTSSEADKRRYQRTWRSLHPQTVKFWSDINRAAIYAVRKPGTVFTCRRLTVVCDGEMFLRITLPSGRGLSYPSPHLTTDKFDNAAVIFKDNAAGKWVDPCRTCLKVPIATCRQINGQWQRSGWSPVGLGYIGPIDYKLWKVIKHRLAPASARMVTTPKTRPPLSPAGVRKLCEVSPKGPQLKIFVSKFLRCYQPIRGNAERGGRQSLAAHLPPAVGGKEFVPHAHDCIGRFFKVDVFVGRCLRNNTNSCLKHLKGAGLESRH
jgi:DNA polymerase